MLKTMIPQEPTEVCNYVSRKNNSATTTLTTKWCRLPEEEFLPPIQPLNKTKPVSEVS
jgi:hypothetical protein